MPDFYQGNELWCFDLVDPDNRRPVDFELRLQMLGKIRAQAEQDRAALVDRLVSNPCDGAIKLYLTSTALRLRREQRALFAEGSYTALMASGNRANHVIGFARTLGRKTLIALAGRFFLRLFEANSAPIGEVWGDTVLTLPRKIKQSSFRDALTGAKISTEKREDGAAIPLAQAFAHCPVALLETE